MKKGLLALSALLAFGIVSCSANNNSDSNNNGGNDNTNGNNTSSVTANEVFSYIEPDTIDIYEDFDNQEKEEVTGTEIDISTLGTSYEISEGGTYILSGTSSDLSITINSSSDVKLVLNDVNITSNSDSPIYVKSANSFELYIPSGTKNYLKDSENNTLDGVITCKSTDLVINGEGYLIIDSLGVSNDEVESGKGIHASKTLVVKDTHIAVNSSIDHALNGKAGVEISDAKLDLTSKADGLHSKEGSISLSNVTLLSSTYGDGIDATNEVSILNSTCQINTTGEFVLYVASEDTDGSIYEDSKYVLENGEYRKISDDDMSKYNTRYYLKEKCKGIKADGKVLIDGGTYYINTTDDGISSDTEITILDGSFYINTLDQGVNSDQLLNIGEKTEQANEDFSIRVFSSYEAIQGGNVNFYDGYHYLVANDDGINATSDTITDINLNFYENSYVNVSASGDGLDSNGNITLEGGTVAVFGPTNAGNGTLDFDKTFTVNSGILIGIGASGMAQNPNDVNQGLIYGSINSSSKEGDLLNLYIDDKEYSVLIPTNYNSLAYTFSVPEIVIGATYNLTKYGTLEGTMKNNIYIGEKVISDDTAISSGSITSLMTSIGGEDKNQPGGGNDRPGGRP